MMQLGVDGVFVGSGIFKSEDPAPRARAIVEATTHFQDPDVLAKVSRGLGEPMRRARRSRSSARRVCSRPAGGEPPVKAGVLALQGDFREHARVFARARRRRGRGADARASSRGVDVPGDPGRRVHDDREARAQRRPRRADRRARERRHADPRDLRRDDRAADASTRRPLLSLVDITVRRNAYGRQVDSLRGRPRRRRRSSTPSAASSSERRASRRSARRSRVLAEHEERAGRPASRAICSWHRSIPS